MKMNVSAKLFGGFGFVIAALIVTGAVAFTQLKTVAKDAHEIYEVDLKSEVAVGEIEAEMLRMREAILSYIIAPPAERGHLLETIHEIEPLIWEQVDFLKEHEVTADQAALIEDAEFNLEEWFRLRDAGPIARVDAGDQAGAAALALSGPGIEAMNAAFSDVADFGHETERLAELADEDAKATASLATTLMVAIIAVSTVVAAAVAFIIARGITQPLNAVKGAMESIAKGDLTVAVKVKVKDEIGQMAQSYSNMQSYLQEMAANAERVGQRDLTVEVKPRSEKDTLGTALATMVTNLRALVGQLTENADSLAATSGQLSSAAEQAGQATQGVAQTSQQVARGAQDQSAAVQKTAASVDELSQAIKQIGEGSRQQAEGVGRAQEIVKQVAQAAGSVAQSAQQAADNSQKVNASASEGRSMMEKTTGGMDRIRTAVEDATARISTLGQKSAEIGKIVAVIDDIAAQTNLLALNAAIEAARAGDQGRGFAVVANEVRQLAERASQSTKEIASLIEAVQKGVAESVQATEAGSKEVVEGTKLADETGKAFTRILESVVAVASQVEQISAAAEEVSASVDDMVKTVEGVSAAAARNSESATSMASSSEQVSAAMENISAVTEQASAAAEEASATTEEMSAQVEEVVASAQTLAKMAEDLNAAVASFKIGDGANAQRAARSGTSDRRDVPQKSVRPNQAVLPAAKAA
jgi:methyl-accepting chemotaxis protein